MKKIIKIVKTSTGCPEQYEGRLETGEVFYVRCRFGECELRVGSQKQWDDWTLPTVEKIVYKDSPFAGFFRPGDLVKLFVFAGILLDCPIDDGSSSRMAKHIKWMEELQNNQSPTDEVRFITLDEDILRGKFSPGAEAIMNEVKAKHKGPINIPRL